MNLAMHLNIYLFPMILLVIIFFAIQRNAIKTMDNRLFCSLLWFTFLLLLTETLTWVVDGISFELDIQLIWILNLIYFVLAPLNPLLWVNYMYFSIENKTLFYMGRVQKLLLFAPLAGYYFLVVMSVQTHWIFSVDRLHHYQRGEFYYLPYLLAEAYLIIAMVMPLYYSLKRKESLHRKKYMKYAVITTIPVASSLLQAVLPAFKLALPVTAFAELLFFCQMQLQQITTDALTGINNRGSFDSYLKNILQKKEQRKMYLFMMDLDAFKKINDQYGHAVGDSVLVLTADLLGRFFKKSDVFLARYGGDEFCAVTPCDSDREAERLAGQLQAMFEKENERQHNPYHMAISVGFISLEKFEGEHSQEVVRCADQMMYENKKRRKRV